MIKKKELNPKNINLKSYICSSLLKDIMKKLSLLFLFALLLTACSDDDDQAKDPIFVTDITITDAHKTFNPGDAVTVKAKGFLESDQLILDIFWPLVNEPLFQEGFSQYNRAIVTERTANSITFRAPGHYPASRVELYLEREGERMPLGEISVSDGQSPKEPQLYGITNSLATYTPTVPRGIVRIDLETKEISDVVRFGEGEDFRQVANDRGTNILCGIGEKDGKKSINSYDLSMHYWGNPTERNVINLCTNFNNIIALQAISDNVLTYYSISSSNTRMNMPPVTAPEINLPDGLKPESLSRYPGARTGSYLLLSADNADGTFSPIVIDLSSERLYRHDPIETNALIPFWIMEPDAKNPDTLKCSGGYIISRGNGSETKFCLWNPITGTLEAPFTTFTNDVRSAAMYFSGDGQTRKLYVQFAGMREGDYIQSYDFQTKEWKMFTFFVPFAEILFAN